MILGTGNDLVDTRRIEKTITRFGDRFIKRCFTVAEIETAEARRAGGTHVETYAKRFAAKEACSKALGTGIDQGVYLHDIGVVNDERGRPTLKLTGGALKRLETMADGREVVIHLTLSDEPPMAAAHVIIETL